MLIFTLREKKIEVRYRIMNEYKNEKDDESEVKKWNAHTHTQHALKLCDAE